MGYDSEKADVFSLGILLFTMYFGQTPFKWNYPHEENYPFFNLLTSGDMSKVELFFENYYLTKYPYSQGLVTAPLIKLFCKMLAIEPTLRPSVGQLFEGDEWLNDP